MKRVFCRVLFFTMSLSLLFVLCACGKHSHTYAQSWSANTLYHWHAADCEHTEEKKDSALHTFGEGVLDDGASEKRYTCTECGHAVMQSDFAAEPLSISLVHSFAPSGATVCAEGYFVGVSDAISDLDRAILLKDTESDALIAVTDLPVSYGTWPSFRYQKGDLVRIVATVVDENHSEQTPNTLEKRTLSFENLNGGVQNTILSRGNEVTYSFADEKRVSAHEQLADIFDLAKLEAYTYVRFSGRVFLNAYDSTKEGYYYRPHMNPLASGASDIRVDGKRTLVFREAALKQNIGDAWEDYFAEDFTTESVAASLSYFCDADFTAVVTGLDGTNFQLTVLDASWLRDPQAAEVESLQDALMETAYAYLHKHGLLEYDQFNGRRMTLAAPEAASSQSYVFLDCSSYVASVYYHTLGIQAIPESFGSQNTKNYALYAKQNLGVAGDVIGYYETLDYETPEEQDALLSQLWSILQPGDILVYRRGSKNIGRDYDESQLSGHAMLYMGNGLFTHSSGTSYNDGSTAAKLLYADTPEKGMDRATKEEYLRGTVSGLSADEVLARGEGSRMLFGDRATIIYNFSIIRPLAREGVSLALTEQAKCRMAMRGLSFELTADPGPMSAVTVGEKITYTLTVRNRSRNSYEALPLCDTLSAGVSFVQGSIPFKTEGQKISASISVGAGQTVSVSFTVLVGSEAAAVQSRTTVGGLAMKNVTHEVRRLTGAQLDAIARAARVLATSGKSFSDPLSLVREAYIEVLGRDPFAGQSFAEVMDEIFIATGENKATLRTDGAYADILADGLFGGSELYGTAAASGHATARTVYQHNLTAGDVILCRWKENMRVYLYLGDGIFACADTLGSASVCENGSEKWVQTGSYYYQRHLLASLAAYEQFAIVRPE